MSVAVVPLTASQLDAFELSQEAAVGAARPYTQLAKPYDASTRSESGAWVFAAVPVLVLLVAVVVISRRRR